MSEAQLERSVLESKEREELFAIADALGTRPTSRAKKADLVTAILRATGVDDPAPADPPPARRTRARKAATPAVAAGEGVAGGAIEGDEAALPLELDEPSVTASAPASTEAPAPSGAPAPTDAPAPSGEASPEAPTTEPAATTDGSVADSVSPTPETPPAGPDRFEGEGGGRRNRRRRGRDRGAERPERELQGVTAEVAYSGDPIPVSGLLDLRDEGYGFLRTSGFLAGADDVYVSISQVRRFALRRGDRLDGAARPAGNNEKYPALLRVDSVSGLTSDEARDRPHFDELTAVAPTARLELAPTDGTVGVAARIVELLAPLGRGQRSLVAGPTGTGATSVLTSLAAAVAAGSPDAHLSVVLLDERPEDITEIRRMLDVEVVSSAFDRPAEEHVAVAELVLERAKRMVEVGRDVVVFLDGATRLARAYNLANPGSGRIVANGIDPVAVAAAKRFFGAGRNTEEAGSLTIVAAVAADTGSGVDAVVFEEIEGAATMQVRLSRHLADRRLFPAIDVAGTQARHEALLYDQTEMDQVWGWRRAVASLPEGERAAAGLEQLLTQTDATSTRQELLAGLAATPAPSAEG